MSFLASLVAAVIEKLLSYILGFISRDVDRAKAIDQINKEEAENAQKLKDAKTLKEREDAARDVLNKL